MGHLTPWLTLLALLLCLPLSAAPLAPAEGEEAAPLGPPSSPSIGPWPPTGSYPSAIRRCRAGPQLLRPAVKRLRPANGG